MTSDKRPTVSELTTAQLVAGGFVRSGVWPHDETNGSIRVDGENRLPSEPGVYAYAVGGVVRYVGSAQRGLRRRLRHYGEWPITRVANGRILSGRIDLLVEQPQCLAVYDHKSFPGGHDRWPAEVAAHAPQLATYAEALRAASGLPIARTATHLPFAGTVLLVGDLLKAREATSAAAFEGGTGRFCDGWSLSHVPLAGGTGGCGRVDGLCQRPRQPVGRRRDPRLRWLDWETRRDALPTMPIDSDQRTA